MARPTDDGTAVDDRRLVAGVLAGDPAAERRLYDANVERVYRLAYRLTGDPDLAQEFTQESFIRAFDRLETFRGDAKLSTWLNSVATSVVFNGMRKVKRFRQREVDLDHAAPEADRKREAEPDLKEQPYRRSRGWWKGIIRYTSRRAPCSGWDRPTGSVR